ncbi:phage tail spike protein [Streptococcus suis]|uniref:phage tail spike protein n=1 Tax=Streptococcus suis TaxID=1307 RepID=UPI000CF3DBB2|nr:phage tail spike protein [Streptococcus suis]
MISVFPSTAYTKSELAGVGYPILNLWCESAKLYIRQNGHQYIKLVIPHRAKGIDVSLLPKELQIIKIHDIDGKEDYYRVRKPQHNLKYTTIYAEHITYDLNDNLIEDIFIVNSDGQQALDKISKSTQYPHPFDLRSDIDSVRNLRLVRVNPMQAILGTEDNTFVNRFGGEVKRQGFTISVNKRVGVDRTDVIRSGKNLTGFEANYDFNDVATRIMPKGPNGILLPEKYVDSPLINHYPIPFIRVIDYKVEYEENFDDLPQTEKNRVYNELRELAKADFKKGVDVPSATYKVNFVSLRNTIEYRDYEALENIGIGDLQPVYEARYDIEIKGRVTDVVWDLLNKNYESITLGNFRDGIVQSTITSQRTAEKRATEAQETANLALRSADGKATNYYGNDEPSNPSEGDLWYKKNGQEDEIWQYQLVDGKLQWVYVTGTLYINELKDRVSKDFEKLNTEIKKQEEAQARQIADVLAKTTSTKEIAEQTVTDLMRVRNAFNQSIGQANAKALELERSIGTVRTDVMSQAQTILAQAQTQKELTNRVASVETTANSTKMTVSELSKTVSKATGDIASVSSRTKTVEDTLSQTRTQYEALTQTVNAQTGQIESINRKTADLQSGIDIVTERFENLRVGGENLLTGTTDFSGSWLNSYSWTREAEKYRGLTVMSRSGEWLGISQAYASEINETYTFSCYIKSSVETDTVICYFAHPITGNPAAVSINSRSISVSNVWKRISVTFSVTRAGNIFPRIERFDKNARVYIAGLKLERGTVATDWSHSDEDLRSEMATYKRTAEETSAELSRQIQMADGKAVDAKSYAQQTATAINARLESLETYKNAEGTRASQYFTASRDETARQVTALRTAVTDGYVAKAKYEEDVRGVTQKFEEISSATDTKIAEHKNTVDGRFATIQASVDSKANQVDFQAVKETAQLYERIIGSTETGIKDKVARMVMADSLFLTEVKDKISGTATQVNQLSNSWAVKNLASAGTVLNQFNLLANGTNRIDGRLTHITGQTLIDNGVIKNAMIGDLDAGKITTGTLDAARIKADSINGSKMVFDQAFVNKMTANEALFKQLFAQSAFITSVQAVAVSAKQIAGGIAKALNGGMDVNFDESKINFYTNVAAIRRIYTGHPTQFIKFETEGNYSRTIIGSNRNGGEVFNSATFAGIVVENTNNINTEDNVRIYGDNTLLRHAQGDVGWNINSVTQRIVPANINAESEIWSKHFVAPDKNSKPVRLDTAVAALWDIWNHIIYNNFEFNEALRTHIKARRDNWKFELNL